MHLLNKHNAQLTKHHAQLTIYTYHELQAMRPKTTLRSFVVPDPPLNIHVGKLCKQAMHGV